jgi:hypothetical protein
MATHYIDRRFMPQIDEGKLIPLLTHLAQCGIHCSFETRPAHSLARHQEVDNEKVVGIMGNKQALDKPLLIAGRGIILDGDHRGEAHKRLGTEAVSVIVVPLAFEDALLALAEAPVSYAYGDGQEHPETI